MDSSRQTGRQSGRSKSIPKTGLCLLTDFQAHGGSLTCEPADGTTLSKSTASRLASLARTSAISAAGAKSASRDWPDRSRDLSAKHFVLSKKFNRLGWSLKTSRACFIRTLAAILNKSSRALPSAIIWDTRECLTLSISESPRDAAAFSWSRVLDATPHWSSWLTPLQWRQYLARLLRSESHGRRVGGLAILARHRTSRAESISAVKFSSLRRTDGVRWLGGKESLRYMGFPSDWMRAIRACGSRPAMRSFRRSPGGSPRSSRSRESAHRGAGLNAKLNVER